MVFDVSGSSLKIEKFHHKNEAEKTYWQNQVDNEHSLIQRHTKATYIPKRLDILDSLETKSSVFNGVTHRVPRMCTWTPDIIHRCHKVTDTRLTKTPQCLKHLSTKLKQNFLWHFLAIKENNNLPQRLRILRLI